MKFNGIVDLDIGRNFGYGIGRFIGDELYSGVSDEFGEIVE